MNVTKTTFGAVAVLATTFTMALPLCAGAAENEYASQLTDLAKGQLRQIAENATLVAAIEAQNTVTGGYDQTKIDALDQQWRTEVDATSKPLIDQTLDNDASKYLAQVQDQSSGLFTEIFATDAKGLNVAQSNVTSDYWQGDEEKFTGSYGVGPDAVVIGDIEQDESTQRYQSQVSITITDPATGAEIGSITAGVDLSML